MWPHRCYMVAVHEGGAAPPFHCCPRSAQTRAAKEASREKDVERLAVVMTVIYTPLGCGSGMWVSYQRGTLLCCI
jgi:hypothetical protein